jgi:transcriptional regulator with XRE-family HTH domain
MFWQKYVELCEKNNEKPRAVATEYGIAPATVTRWKNGSVPGKETLQLIADRFNVSVDYLINDSEISLDINGKRSTLKKLTALPQRWASLHGCCELSKMQIVEITEYVNASLFFINSEKCVEYVPENEVYDKKQLLNIEILFTILNVMDGCADTDFYRTLQIQLSRIVLSHLKDKGYTRDKLSGGTQISSDKLEFLTEGKEKADITLNYGLNYSDLAALCEYTGVSYIYMFTGVDGKYSDIVESFAD